MDITYNFMKSQLDNTILPLILSNIILNYMESTIHVLFEYNTILYSTQSEFEDFDCKDVKSLRSSNVNKP